MTSSICPTASSVERSRSRSRDDRRLTATAFEGGLPRSRSSVCCASNRSSSVSCAAQRVEIACRADSQRLDAGKPRKCRTLHHMVANRERAGRGDDPEQPNFFQIDPALAGLEPAEQAETAFAAAGGLRQELGEAKLAASGIERVTPDRRAQTAVAVHGAHVEEDVHRQQ